MTEFHGETLAWRVEGGVIDLRLDHAPCNEIGSRTLLELERFVAEAPLDSPDVRALIIHSGQTCGFGAGADLRELYARSQAIDPRAAVGEVRTFLTRVHAVLHALDTAPVVTVVAAHGVTFGGSLELALVGDIRIAEQTTRFAFPELRLGLIPGFGGIPRLKRDVGNGIVRDLLLTGRSINASKALEIGLVSQLVAPGEALGAARGIAAQVSKLDAAAARAAKGLVKPIPTDDLRHEIEIFCELFTRPAVQIALRNFVEDSSAQPYLP